MNIKTKILFPSVVASAMMLVLGIVSYVGMRGMESALESVAGRGMQHVALLNDGRNELLEANVGAYRAFSTMANMDEARIKKETDAIVAHADAAIAHFRQLGERSDLDEDERQRLTQLQEPLAKYRKSVAQAIDMAQSDLAAGTGMMQAADKRFLEINAGLAAIMEAQRKQSAELASAAERRATAAIVTEVVVFLVGLVAVIAVALVMAGRIVAPLLSAIGTAKSIAKGDLTAAVATGSSDESGDLLRGLAEMQGRLRSLIGQIANNARGTAAACRSLSMALEKIDKSVAGQNDATATVAAAVEQMSVSVNNIHDSASHALVANKTSAEHATAGATVIDNASREMLNIANTVKEAADVVNRVGRESDEISAVVSVIREVADQTNLLALNAAIEAARAGEQGRGFAVVADEVRKLAEKTTSSAGEISTMILRIQESSRTAVDNIRRVVDEVEATVALASNASNSIGRIQESARMSEGFAHDITNALAEQSQASHLIAQQVEGITLMSDENAQSVSSADQAMRDLEREALVLEQAVAQFRV